MLLANTIKFASFPGTNSPEYLENTWENTLKINVDFQKDMSVWEIVESLENGNLNMALIAWDVEYPDPDSILRILFSRNSPMNCFSWFNDEFDILIETATKTLDQQKRLSLYHQADYLLVNQEVAIVPLFYYQAYGVINTQFELTETDGILRGGTLKFKQIKAN